MHAMGFAGCDSNEYAPRMMVALGSHPNVGGVLLVSLGCEGTDARALAGAIRQTGRPVEVLRIQEQGGTEPTIRRRRELAAKMLEELERLPRQPMTVADLVIGTECGGSDATSGISANPAVGSAFDLIVDAGGTAIIEETLESARLPGHRRRPWRYAESGCGFVGGSGQSGNLLPSSRSVFNCSGEPRGGIITIEEKSTGAFAKCGARPIQGVIKVAETPPHKGLWVLS